MDTYEKQGRLYASIDQIREKYRDEAIYREAYAGGSIRPLNGGIRKEKFRVDGILKQI